MKNIKYTLLAALAAVAFTSCDKVSPIGVLVSGTGVEDRVKMSSQYYEEHKLDYKSHLVVGDYTFLVGADSHLTTDDSRMAEMLQIGLDGNDLFWAHLGDIADTKAEYYITLENVIERYKRMWAEKHYEKVFVGDENDPAQLDDDDYYFYSDGEKLIPFEQLQFPFYPVVGNHDITHNGWALWSNIFHSSFYQVGIIVLTDLEKGEMVLDRLIFLDSASGTLGREQVDLIEQGTLDAKEIEKEYGVKTRNTFVFSHTNIFRPRSVEFASTFPREEMFFLLDKFAKWNANIVFLGHVHKWDEQVVNGIEYLTLDSMCEENNPEPGDYLVRVKCEADGTVTWSPVHMNTRKH